MRANRIPRVPHSCLKLNFVLTFVLMFVFTYAILGSGGGDHSGETWGSSLWRTSGWVPVVDIYFSDGYFFAVEDMGEYFFLFACGGEDTGSVCGQARSGGYAGHAPTHSPRERPRRARPRCCAPRYGIFNYPILHQGIH